MSTSSKQVVKNHSSSERSELSQSHSCQSDVESNTPGATLEGNCDPNSSDQIKDLNGASADSKGPYICPAEGCGKSFDRHYGLRVHFRKHSGETPYLCEICKKTFRWRSSASHHRNTQHPGEPKTPIIARKSSPPVNSPVDKKADSVFSDKAQEPESLFGYEDDETTIQSCNDLHFETVDCQKNDSPESPVTCQEFAFFIEDDANEDWFFEPEELPFEDMISPVPLEQLDRKEVLEVLKDSKIFDGIENF